MRKSSAVTVDYLITKKLLAEFYYFTVLFYKRSTAPMLTFCLLTGISLMMLGGIALNLSIIVLSFLGFHVFGLYKGYRNYMDLSAPALGQQQSVRVDDKGLRAYDYEEGIQALKEYRWREIRHISESPRLVLFYTEPGSAVMVPKRQISTGELEILRDLARKNFTK